VTSVPYSDDRNIVRTLKVREAGPILECYRLSQESLAQAHFRNV
jgi:hypothetical protein